MIPSTYSLRRLTQTDAEEDEKCVRHKVDSWWYDSNHGGYGGRVGRREGIVFQTIETVEVPPAEVAGMMGITHASITIGCAHIRTKDIIDAGWLIEDIFMLPTRRRSGHGKRMMQAIEAAARMDNNVQRICLVVESSNVNVLPFYFKAGYQLVGIDVKTGLYMLQLSILRPA